MKHSHLVLFAIVLSSSVGFGRVSSTRALALGGPNDPNGSVHAGPPDAKDKELTIAVSGDAAELMYNMLAYGTSMPNELPKEKPKTIWKSGLQCGLSTDRLDRAGSYFCYFAVVKEGVSKTYHPKIREN